MAAVRAKISVQEGTPAMGRLHMEIFIKTLDDNNLAKLLTLVRLRDAGGINRNFARLPTHGEMSQ